MKSSSPTRQKKKFACWVGNKKEGFVPYRSIEDYDIELARIQFMNSLLMFRHETKTYKGIEYMEKDGVIYVVFEEGTGPSIHLLKGAFEPERPLPPGALPLNDGQKEPRR